MKAITVKQPWASLICIQRKDNSQLGIKNIENRTWKTNFRGRILIHAGSKPALEYRERSLLGFYQIGMTEQMILEANKYLNWINFLKENSAIIGSVEIIDCVINHPSIWAEKSEFSPYRVSGVENEELKPIYNWVLANPILFNKPILNVKGKLSFWEPEEWVKNELNKML